MQVIRWLLMILSGSMLFGGCITPFSPEINESVEIMVIYGTITDQEGVQRIEVSKTSPVGGTESFIPLSNCIVEVLDDNDKMYQFLESSPGTYTSWMAAEDLVPGTKYKATVTTQEGKQYFSEFEELLRSPPIDSIFWEIRNMGTTTRGENHQGVQFYVATDASGDYAKHYRWELEETWEYHSPYDIWGYYDGEISYGAAPSDSLRVCYQTMRIDDFYTFSTRHLSSDNISRIPINYVSNQTDRLKEKYSLLVTQYSMTESAYEFWTNLEDQLKQSGELYTTQPARISGNLRVKGDTEETVLGFFSASSITEQRIFIKPRISIDSTLVCDPSFLEEDELLYNLSQIDPAFYPIYLYYVDVYGYEGSLFQYNIEGQTPRFDYASQDCFDCRRIGGTLQRPDYWE